MSKLIAVFVASIMLLCQIGTAFADGSAPELTATWGDTFSSSVTGSDNYASVHRVFPESDSTSVVWFMRDNSKWYVLGWNPEKCGEITLSLSMTKESSMMAAQIKNKGSNTFWYWVSTTISTELKKYKVAPGDSPGVISYSGEVNSVQYYLDEKLTIYCGVIRF